LFVHGLGCEDSAIGDFCRLLEILWAGEESTDAVAGMEGEFSPAIWEAVLHSGEPARCPRFQISI